MTNKKLIIWDLFGGSQNSVWKSLQYFEKQVEIYTFDINPNLQHKNQIVMDLGVDYEQSADLIRELEKYPKPDLIFASPLCTTFSWILHVGPRETLAWKETQHCYVKRSPQEMDLIKQNNGFLKPMNSQAMFEKAVLGENCLRNTIGIITYFKPKFWYIENPEKSIMWKVIEKNFEPFTWFGKYNLAHYNSYDLSFTQKPTIFFSNAELDLKKYGIKGNCPKPKKSCRSNVWFENQSRNKNEQGPNVAIPKTLIIDIYHQMVKQIEFKEKKDEISNEKEQGKS